MNARLIRIAGRVQGVGYRDWLLRRATEAGLSGWVRNRADGTVEALLAGLEPAVEQVLRECRAGPPAARVDSVSEAFAEEPAEPGFSRRPTA